MKTKNSFWIFSFVAIGVALMLISSCKKDDTDKDTPADKTGIVFNPGLTYGTVTDIDGYTYKTIKIGTQTWMAENLRVVRYRNGDSIPKVANNVNWYNITTGAYCDYGNLASKSAVYGKLYNWRAVVDSRNICPVGWHVPDDAEWEELFVYLGGYQVIGGKMKETGTTHWSYINDGTNESGFTGLPGGMRYFDGGFIDIGQSGYWWSSTDCPDYYDLDAYYQYLSGAGDNNVGYGTGSKNNGMSVRCVKD